MRKPSPAQMKMLERMAGGDEVWTMTLVHSSAFWQGSLATANLGTLMALRKRGLVENYGGDWRGGKYRITKPGRYALAGAAP